MIFLDEANLISRGQLRSCYQHPENMDRIIKIPAGDKKECLAANISELKGYHSLMLKHTDLFCVSHCYGFIRTNLGRGLECDCIRDESGRISKTLWDIVIFEDDPDIDYIIKVIENFCDYLISEKIFLFDLNLKNVALRQLSDGSYQPTAIDLKGVYDNHELIPVSSYFEFLGRKKLKRRCSQLIDRIPYFREIRMEFQKSSK